MDVCTFWMFITFLHHIPPYEARTVEFYIQILTRFITFNNLHLHTITYIFTTLVIYCSGPHIHLWDNFFCSLTELLPIYFILNILTQMTLSSYAVSTGYLFSPAFKWLIASSILHPSLQHFTDAVRLSAHMTFIFLPYNHSTACIEISKRDLQR